MPRQARKLSRTGVYHVMLRGINRQDIFEDDEDYRQMTGCLRSLTERYDEMITRTVPMIPEMVLEENKELAIEKWNEYFGRSVKDEDF